MNMSIPQVIIYILAVLFAMSFHEMAHSLASSFLGDQMARTRGRVSLNPFAHIDWTGFACLLLFGFGWAKPVPVDPWKYKDPKAGMAWTAFAGPLANFILSFLCVFVYFLLAVLAPSFVSGSIGSFIESLLMTTASLSAGFGIFNLIPIPPLDGARIFWAFLPDREYFKINESRPWMTILFLVLIVSGILNSPLAAMRSTLLQWMANASIWIIQLFV
jgi:Zn-dependent protease